MKRNEALARVKTLLMKLRITHETHYNYSPTVVTAQHVAHLEPVNTPCQTCLSHSFSTLPVSPKLKRQPDAFGNLRYYLSLPVPHNNLLVHAQSTLETYSLPQALATALQDRADTLTWSKPKQPTPIGPARPATTLLLLLMRPTTPPLIRHSNVMHSAALRLVGP